MSVGNFRETKEKDETTEKMERAENQENQILKTPDAYKDDFDRKLDISEENKEKQSAAENETSENRRRKEGQEKEGILDRMKKLFSEKESGKEGEMESGERREGDSHDKFEESLKKDSPSYAEQSANTMDMQGRDEYLESREKSDRAYEENPDKKSWELSSEQMEDYKNGEKEILDKYKNETM